MPNYTSPYNLALPNHAYSYNLAKTPYLTLPNLTIPNLSPAIHCHQIFLGGGDLLPLNIGNVKITEGL